ncbi:MAG: LAGLIDADG family homing endonuclease [archaeon]
MARIYFDSDEIRCSFFENVKAFSGSESWTEFYHYCNKRKNLMEYYRFGQLTMPLQLFDMLCEILPKKLVAFFRSGAKRQDENWGRVKAGFATYNKHKSIFEEGRSIAIKKNYLRQLKTSFDANMPLSEELCEFLGCFIGDGFTNKCNRTGQIQFAGDSRFDRAYYNSTIIPIARKLFALKSPYIRVKNNSLWVNFYSKRLFEFLTERFNMPAGVKFDKVMIPEEILGSETSLLVACIRGIFDTDGCIYFDKRKIYKEPYIRIELNMHNERLIEQISCCLKDLDINVKKLSNGWRLQIIGKKSVQQFLEKVGFSNNKHRNRIAAQYPSLEKITNKLQLNS